MKLTEKQFRRRVIVGKLYRTLHLPLSTVVGFGAITLADYALGTLMNIYCFGNPDGYHGPDLEKAG